MLFELFPFHSRLENKSEYEKISKYEKKQKVIGTQNLFIRRYAIYLALFANQYEGETFLSWINSILLACGVLIFLCVYFFQEVESFRFNSKANFPFSNFRFARIEEIVEIRKFKSFSWDKHELRSKVLQKQLKHETLKLLKFAWKFNEIDPS